MLLKDKIAVITGDAYGVGQAAARLFTHEGARVVLIDDLAAPREAATLDLGGAVIDFIHADVTNSEAVQAAAQACAQRLPQLDVLFNVAGRSPVHATFEQTSEETWQAMIGRNLTSAFLCSKYFLPLLKRAGTGAVIHHASIDAMLGNPGIAAYSAGKGGLLPLTHVMAHDLAKYGIRVNSISTGGIRAPGGTPGAHDQARIAVTPMARMGTAEDVARVALFLASDLASYVNGTNIVCDGGRIATTHGCYEDGR